MGCFSYTSCAGFFFYRLSFFYTSHAGFIFVWGVSLKHPVLVSFLCAEFLFHIPCWLHFYLGSFSYTSHADFSSFFLWSFSDTSHTGFFSFYLGSFSYTSRAGFFFYRLSFSNTSRAGFIFVRGVPVIHPVLASFFCAEFLLHILCWLHFYLGSFLFVFPVEFLLYIPFFFSFLNLGSFSYTSHAGFFSFFVCVGSFSGMQSSLKTTPKQKSWVEDGPERKKSEKVTLKTEKELYNTLYRRTKPNKNWVTNGHRKERGIKEVNPGSEQALAKKAKKWMDPSSTNYSEDNH